MISFGINLYETLSGNVIKPTVACVRIFKETCLIYTYVNKNYRKILYIILKATSSSNKRK